MVDFVDRDGNVHFNDPLAGDVVMAGEAFQAMLRGAVLPEGHGVDDTNAKWDVGSGTTSSVTGAARAGRSATPITRTSSTSYTAF
jgi:hypothetical protein